MQHYVTRLLRYDRLYRGCQVVILGSYNRYREESRGSSLVVHIGLYTRHSPHEQRLHVIISRKRDRNRHIIHGRDMSSIR